MKILGPMVAQDYDQATTLLSQALAGDPTCIPVLCIAWCDILTWHLAAGQVDATVTMGMVIADPTDGTLHAGRPATMDDDAWWACQFLMARGRQDTPALIALWAGLFEDGVATPRLGEGVISLLQLVADTISCVPFGAGLPANNARAATASMN
jgi:hypothetical protein